MKRISTILKNALKGWITSAIGLFIIVAVCYSVIKGVAQWETGTILALLVGLGTFLIPKKLEDAMIEAIKNHFKVLLPLMIVLSSCRVSSKMIDVTRDRTETKTDSTAEIKVSIVDTSKIFESTKETDSTITVEEYQIITTHDSTGKPVKTETKGKRRISNRIKKETSKQISNAVSVTEENKQAVTKTVKNNVTTKHKAARTCGGGAWWFLIVLLVPLYLYFKK